MKNMSQLEFEKPILELENKILSLRNVEGDGGINIADEITRMEGKVERLLNQTYSKLTPAQKVQVARHQDRPHYGDYVAGLIDDYTTLAGDRNFAEDHALPGGIGRFRGQSVVVMGQERGHDTESRLHHNFGMARPEGYRKAQRLMRMAEQFQIPILTLVDTAGAYPGIGAEERGQAEAIAKSIETCLSVRVPIISVIIGEGGSGGAIAIATADKVLMLEHSIYSVISPEGAASILFGKKDENGKHVLEAPKEKIESMTTSLKLTAQDLLELKIIDDIIKEPVGGAHRNKADTIELVGAHIEKTMKTMIPWDIDKILDDRAQKYLKIGR